MFDPAAAADFVKVTFQMQLRGRCQEERQHFVDVCRDYLTRSFEARIRAAQDRVMALRMREAASPKSRIARQRAENELADIERTRKRTARRAGPADSRQARPCPPRRHGAGATSRRWCRLRQCAGRHSIPNIRRRSELAAEDVVVAYETGRGGSASGSAI